MLAYLARKPYDNVFLSWLITNERSSNIRSAIHLYIDAHGAIRGVAFFGRQVVLAADNDEVVDAFAAAALGYRYERMIVGPRPIIERYWECVRSWHTPPRIVRESQPVLAVDRSHLRMLRGPVSVRRARPAEWPTVAENSAQMIAHELEYDPRQMSADFNANVRIMIDRGLWWVGESHGDLCFFCNVGPRSHATLQLQGIWTPPRLRGAGLATMALGAVCDQLLDEAPTLSLYVNGFNERALRLYDRVGFRAVGEFKTILF